MGSLDGSARTLLALPLSFMRSDWPLLRHTKNSVALFHTSQTPPPVFEAEEIQSSLPFFGAVLESESATLDLGELQEAKLFVGRRGVTTGFINLLPLSGSK